MLLLLIFVDEETMKNIKPKKVTEYRALVDLVGTYEYVVPYSTRYVVPHMYWNPYLV